MVEVFKTNIQTEKEANFVREQLQKEFPDYKINFDLEDCDNILRIETSGETVNVVPVTALVKRNSFTIEVLTDTPVAHAFLKG